MKNFQTPIDALDDLKKRGYDTDFETQSFCLYCGDLDMRLDPEDFHVDEVYRFNGDANPEGSSVIYAISSSTGVKGTLLNTYGGHSDNLNSEMKKKLQDHPAFTN